MDGWMDGWIFVCLFILTGPSLKYSVILSLYPTSPANPIFWTNIFSLMVLMEARRIKDRKRFRWMIFLLQWSFLE